MEAEIFIFYFICFWDMGRGNSTYSVRGCNFSSPKYFFIFLILVPKYPEKWYGGPMEAEISIFNFKNEMPRAVQLDLNLGCWQIRRMVSPFCGGTLKQVDSIVESWKAQGDLFRRRQFPTNASLTLIPSLLWKQQATWKYNIGGVRRRFLYLIPLLLP